MDILSTRNLASITPALWLLRPVIPPPDNDPPIIGSRLGKRPPGLPIRHRAQGIMRTYHTDNGDLVNIDSNTPDRIMARSEPLHPSDGDFDHELAPCDGGETFDAAGLKSIPRQALLILLRFIFPPPNGTRPLRVAQLRLIALAHLAGLEGVGDRTLTDLAQELACTKSLLSLYSVRLTDQLGQAQVRGGKNRAARETYRQRALATHRAAGHRMSADKASEEVL